MYSLGIIFFEMCFAFKTGMERVQTLTALRGPEVPFPTSWPVDLKPKQREIISLLLRHDPTMRPQAAQLLAGPLVPSPDKEQKLYDNVITGMYTESVWTRSLLTDHRDHQPPLGEIPGADRCAVPIAQAPIQHRHAPRRLHVRQ